MAFRHGERMVGSLNVIVFLFKNDRQHPAAAHVLLLDERGPTKNNKNVRYLFESAKSTSWRVV